MKALKIRLVQWYGVNWILFYGGEAMYYFIFLRHLTEIWHRIAHSESVEEELFGVSSLLLFIK